VQSYGSSGEQARAVLSGLKADAVALSLEPDMTSLVRGDLVAQLEERRVHGHGHALGRRLRRP
jgi:ABC-type sulfate transport system substrate-binding protein